MKHKNRWECTMIKRMLAVGLAVVLLVAVSTVAEAACSSTIKYDKRSSARTIRFSFDCDTLSDIGGSFQDDSAAYTGWTEVPPGISFSAFIMSPDADSNLYGHYNDTIHVTLQTAPAMSFAVDSAGTIALRGRRRASVINLWTSVSTGYTKITQMRYFNKGQGVADTAWQTPNAAAAAKDTIDVADASLKTFAFGDMNGATWLPMNLGFLRWQVHQGTADMITDGKLRLHMFIVWHETRVLDGKSYGDLSIDDNWYASLEAQTLSEALGYNIAEIR